MDRDAQQTAESSNRRILAVPRAGSAGSRAEHTLNGAEEHVSGTEERQLRELVELDWTRLGR